MWLHGEVAEQVTRPAVNRVGHVMEKLSDILCAWADSGGTRVASPS